MPCYYPLTAYRPYKLNSDGTRDVLWQEPKDRDALEVEYKCRNCIGCRLDRSRDWAVRCDHEASLYTENCFITLTYNDENIPDGDNLVVEHWQNFMKALRQKEARQAKREKRPPRKVRYFMGAEYGENQNPLTVSTQKLGRPHFHAILFNFDFSDKTLKTRRNDNPLYESEWLNKTWGKGFCTIGDANYTSAAYVARYCMKKMNGELADDHYTKIDDKTGEYNLVRPEFSTQSKGIGRGWYEKFSSDLIKGYLTVNGRKTPIPEYYMKLIEAEDPGLADQIKLKAIAHFKPEDSTIERLRVREKCRKAKIKSLKREI